MAEAKVGTHFSGGNPLIGLGNDILEDGEVAKMGFPCLGIELEIVYFPEGDALLRGEDIVEFEVCVQGFHAGGEEVKIGDEIPLFVLRNGVVPVNEKAVQDGLVVHRTADILIPCLLEGNGGNLVVVLPERIAAVKRKDGRKEEPAEVLEDVKLGVLSLEAKAEGDGHDAAGAGGSPCAHMGVVPED